jgi:hypothetical protein
MINRSRRTRRGKRGRIEGEEEVEVGREVGGGAVGADEAEGEGSSL